jgi:hypothetical protein
MVVWIRSLAVLAAILLAFQSAHARDRDGKYANSPLHEWFEQLASKKGRCCSDADGRALSDLDWESHDGHYRVQIDGEWVNVPEDAVVTEPNLCGADDGLAYLVGRAPSNSLLHAGEHDLEISIVQ